MNALSISLLLLISGYVSSLTLYCPSSNDLVAGWGANDVTLQNRGWKIIGTNAGGAAATKAAFDVRGGYISYTINLASVNYYVNANLYGIFPSIGSSGFPAGTSSGNGPYCDGQGSGSTFCPELDFIEGNGHCCAGSTVHSVEGTSSGNCDKNGCQATYNLASSTVNMNVTFSSQGVPTHFVNGAAIPSLSPSASGAGSALNTWFSGKGLVLYSSMWQGWSPTTSSCTTSSQPWGSLSTSSFSISNLQIYGSVKAGPTPATCSGTTTTPPPATTTKAPTTPAPSTCNFNTNLAGKQCRGLTQKTGVTSQSACQSACCSTSGCKVYQWWSSNSQCWIGSSTTKLTTSNCPSSSGSFVSFSTAALTSAAEVVSSGVEQNYPYIIVGVVVVIILIAALVFTLRSKARKRGQTMSDYVRQSVAQDKTPEHVPLESTPSVSVLPPQETATEAAPIVLATPQQPEWEQRVDETSGQTIYYNTASGVTQWEAPDGYIAPTATAS
jgi:hypothetical protein